MSAEKSFASLLITHWEQLQQALLHASRIPISGNNLSVANVVAVARYEQKVALDFSVIPAIEKSAVMMKTLLNKGEVIYGVNTGFGGSASSRTQSLSQWQDHLITCVRHGIIEEEARRQPKVRHEDGKVKNLERSATATLNLPASMPSPWVKATILIRANTLASGASGVRATIIHTLISLLNEDITPLLPLRGSISASGDLSPLGYVGAVLQGRSNARVIMKRDEIQEVVSAKFALQQKAIAPIGLRPKEGLALVNGTAVSAAVGALAMHDALLLVTLAQMITAMSTEALAGTEESFDAFIANVRPHPGQLSVSKLIRYCLQGSRFTLNDHSSGGSLRQDRYSIRTGPQWLGPIVEDMQLAFSQIAIELNSVTDNPLLDTENARILNGGNFQAKSVTNAMEKTRQGCEGIGRVLFAQTTELINPATNKGLPPNLVIDEPSTSCIWKGIDVHVAALQSELGFLTSSVASRTQTAEMGNQALNSLALISCRYTVEAMSILAQMTAMTLITICQALDIRALDQKFRAEFHPVFDSDMQRLLLDMNCGGGEYEHYSLRKNSWNAFSECLVKSSTLDSLERFQKSVEATWPVLFVSLPLKPDAVSILCSWTQTCVAKSSETYYKIREEHFRNPDTVKYLGRGSQKLYSFVRQHCGVPFLRNENLDENHADEKWPAYGEGNDAEEPFEKEPSDVPTMGSHIANVFESIRDGAIWPLVVSIVSEAEKKQK